MRFTLATSIVTLAVLAAATPQPVGRNVGLTIPITKRSGLTRADKSVDIEALKSHAASTKAKVLRGLNNFQRNTGAPHPDASKGTQKRATGSDALTDDSDQLWYGNVDVGTPPVTFTVSFDTGSSDFFVPSSACSNCGSHTRYDPGASSTSSDLGKTFSLFMGNKKTVSGEQYSDTVSVAGLTATDQTLGSATEYSSSFESGPADGLMGMAFPSLSAYPATPFFNTLIEQGVVDAGQFSFKLADSGSSLFLGGADTSLYTGPINWNPVTQQGYWQVKMDGVVGNRQTILSNLDSIIDTGTTLIVGKPSDVKTFYDALGGTDASSTVGAGYYTFPCNSFPNVSFTFNGASFPISEKTLNLGPASLGSSDCVSGIIGQDTASSFWVIGDVFLRNVYAVFDFDNSRVGFATLA
ncbi:acid protease [Imleria badia]|nr:acid protease [Imleria badia]